jgi:tetratricopeptide (TPR) repeat protein
MCYLALAQEAAPALHGPRQRAWLDRLDAERDNLRAALAWALAHEPLVALDLVVALYRFWEYRTEGREWTERALSAAASAAPEVRLQALNWSSAFASIQADFLLASVRAEEALALARSVGDLDGEGWALISLGTVAAARETTAGAAARYAEAEDRFRSAGNRFGISTALFYQGVEAGFAGEPDRQCALFEQSLAESRAIGDRLQASWVLQSLGESELGRGNLGRARALFEEALVTAREFGRMKIEAQALLGLAEVAGKLGQTDHAHAYLREAEATYRAMESGVALALGLNDLGYLALVQGNPSRAIALIEEAVDLARGTGTPLLIDLLHSLGDALRASGDPGNAALGYREALVRAQEMGDTFVLMNCLSGLAGLAADGGRHAAAARLYGAIEALRKTVGLPGSHYEKQREATDMAAVRAALGATTDAEARAVGRALPMDEVVHEALALADTLATTAEE